MSDDLTKLTVNLTPRSIAAVRAAALMTGDSETDVVNRAVQAYAQMAEVGMHTSRYSLVVTVGSRPLHLSAGRDPAPKRRWRLW